MIKVARAGNVIGEYERADIPALVRSKVVLPTDDYWEDGMTGWAKVSELPANAAASKPSKKILVGGAAVVLVSLCLAAAFFLPSGHKQLEPKEQEAFRAYEEKAIKGDALSQVNLAYCFENGKGIEASKEQAENWYLKAAESGNPSYMHSVAGFYERIGRKKEAYAYYKLCGKYSDSKIQAELLESDMSHDDLLEGARLYGYLKAKLDERSGK
jgi:TPR repeat protein